MTINEFKRMVRSCNGGKMSDQIDGFKVKFEYNGEAFFYYMGWNRFNNPRELRAMVDYFQKGA